MSQQTVSQPTALPTLPSVGLVPALIVVPAPAAAPGSASPRASTAAAGGTLTVQPDSNLTDGQTVTVTGSHMQTNSYGSVLECNLTNNEPTVQVEGNAVPVGCTDPLKTIQSTDASGAFTKQFTVHTGTIGPPGQGTDSAGRSASADAANYPCPPTPAQQASGSTCDIVFGDTGGDANTTPITFAGQSSGSGGAASQAGSSSASTTAPGGTSSGATSTVPGPNATGSSGSGGGSSAGSPSTAAGGTSGTLAFTGFGPGLLLLTRLGLLCTISGLLLLALAIVRIRSELARRRGRQIASA